MCARQRVRERKREIVFERERDLGRGRMYMCVREYMNVRERDAERGREREQNALN